MFRLAMRYCELSDIYLACVFEARSSGAMGLILPLVPFQMSYDHLVCNGIFLIESWTNANDEKSILFGKIQNLNRCLVKILTSSYIWQSCSKSRLRIYSNMILLSTYQL